MPVSTRARTPLHRSVIVLAVGTMAVLIFILSNGDARRRQRALEQVRWLAASLAERVSDAGVLPLNLEPASPPGRRSRAFRVEWLTRDEARRLRQGTGRTIAVQTVPILQMLRRDGRAVVFFENGRFAVDWLTLPEFDERYAAQRDELHRLTDDAGRNPPPAP